MGFSFKRFAFISIACVALAACNRTEGECYEVGQGGAPGPGAGGGPIVPVGAGGNGDVPPDQNDVEGADPCNAGDKGQTYTCNGNIVCTKPNGVGGVWSVGCYYAVRRFVAASADKLVADLLKLCQKENPDYACEVDDLICSNTPATLYNCNGGISCIDDKNNQSGCVVGGEPTDPHSSLAGDVYAYSEADARDHLADLCEILKHDATGNNCANGGACCIPSSVTCSKAP